MKNHQKHKKPQSENAPRKGTGPKDYQKAIREARNKGRMDIIGVGLVLLFAREIWKRL